MAALVHTPSRFGMFKGNNTALRITYCDEFISLTCDEPLSCTVADLCVYVCMLFRKQLRLHDDG